MKRETTFVHLLLGVLSLVLVPSASIPSPAQTFIPLVSFEKSNGANPYLGNLVQGFDGNFYGTTSKGGANGSGTVYKITPTGTLTTLYSFCAQPNCTDGAYPQAGLVLATNGNFYGTTLNGGTGVNCGLGCGTVFKITASGKLTTVYSFCIQTNCADGYFPYAGLVQATNGNFYGTTPAGGANGSGTVFKITPGGTLTTLYSFCAQPNCTDGALAYAGLIQATNGNFYGTTQQGGNSTNCNFSCGTIFRITPAGTLTTLYNFCVQAGCPDGYFPYLGGALVQASNGNFYGTMPAGGANGSGTVYKITPTGTLTTLYSFCAQTNCADGASPLGGLGQATDGNLYGTTTHGGGSFNCLGGCGTAFQITPSGTLTELHSFVGVGGDASAPVAGLVQATNGNFYGTTMLGGFSDNCFEGCGTVFGLSVGLGPFVETLPTSGKVGARVIILGNNLTGTTSVTFNGTAATFTVVTSTEIMTTVPTGATTGKVIVMTPKKSLKSNVAFRVKL